jgi:GntR family transcriptional regulator
LADEFKVSLGTMRKAILNLVAEGFLFRVQGKGTMVAGSSMIRENLRYYRFFREFGGREASLRIEFLDLSVVPGVGEVNKLLKLKPEEDLYLFRRRFWSQKNPILYSVSYLPYERFKGLEKISKTRIQKVPIYIVVEEAFGVPTLSNEELLGVSPASKDVSDVLGIPESDPVLKVEMLSFSHQKKPYEFRTTYCLTDRGKLHREY